MATNGTLLCIHRNPAQLSLLEQSGYELLTATNGHDGLRLFMSRPVDAVILAYQLELLDGGVVAAEIKKIKPKIPIVMLAEEIEPPPDALHSIDALITRSDGPLSLLSTIRSVLVDSGAELSAPALAVFARPKSRQRCRTLQPKGMNANHRPLRRWNMN